MNFVWFAAMVSCLTLVGVATQLGWQPPTMPQVKRALARVRVEAVRAEFRSR